MFDHLKDWYPGDLEAARRAHAERAQQAGGAQSAAEPPCSDPDCGPFSAQWYAGDLEAAQRAHEAHTCE